MSFFKQSNQSQLNSHIYVIGKVISQSNLKAAIHQKDCQTFILLEFMYLGVV